jgi:hypothetical protein
VEAKVSSHGVRVDATRKHHATVDDFDGRHMWVVAAVWRVTNPAATNKDLDLENLLTLEGPGCWFCQQKWKPTIGSKCPGEPEEGMPH